MLNVCFEQYSHRCKTSLLGVGLAFVPRLYLNVLAAQPSLASELLICNFFCAIIVGVSFSCKTLVGKIEFPANTPFGRVDVFVDPINQGRLDQRY